MADDLHWNHLFKIIPFYCSGLFEISDILVGIII